MTPCRSGWLRLWNSAAPARMETIDSRSAELSMLGKAHTVSNSTQKRLWHTAEAHVSAETPVQHVEDLAFVEGDRARAGQDAAAMASAVAPFGHSVMFARLLQMLCRATHSPHTLISLPFQQRPIPKWTLNP